MHRSIVVLLCVSLTLLPAGCARQQAASPATVAAERVEPGSEPGVPTAFYVAVGAGALLLLLYGYARAMPTPGL